MAKRESNPDRWARLVTEAREAFNELSSQIDNCRTALEALDELREEYSEKYENLTENLQSTAYGEKLSAMSELDLQSAISQLDELSNIESAIDEADGMDIPLGFGRD